MAAGLPPDAQLFDNLAQTGTPVFADPFWRNDLIPGRVVEPMLVVSIRVTFPEVRMGIGVAKNGGSQCTLDARVVLVLDGPDVLSTSGNSHRENLSHVADFQTTAGVVCRMLSLPKVGSWRHW